MNSDRPEHPGDFTDVERRLAAGRPSFNELELDKIKLRAVARASRPRRTGGQTKGIALRSRVLRVAVSLVAFGGTAIGGIAAFDVLANASTAQYGVGYHSCGIPDNTYVLNVGGTASSTAGTAAAIPMTATLEECTSSLGGTLKVVTAPSNITILLSCTTTATEPPALTEAACPSTATFATTSGGTPVSSITLLAGQSVVDFYAGFSAAGSPVVVAAGNGIGTQGTAANPYAGYQAETISAAATESAAGTYTLTVPAGVTSFGFTMAGAGGAGGGTSGGNGGAAGAAGAGLTGTITIPNSSSSTEFSVVVGAGGGASSGNGGAGGAGCAAGGAGGNGTSNDGGGGGGSTCIYLQGSPSGTIVAVGGGGGGGGGTGGVGGAGDSTVSNPGTSIGGAGSNGSTGIDGGGGGSTTTSGSSSPFTISAETGGLGGTGGSAGKTGGTCSSGSCTAGGAGGAGSVGGGGGGGGEASGGGGAGDTSFGNGAGGAGGSSFDGGTTNYTVGNTGSATGSSGGGSHTAGIAGSVSFTASGLTLS